ncbi:RNA polymerase II-associated protein [Salix suchowensis]|nr:RNA polymerase II-associated protein [Salix suchowensis]
MAKAPGKHGCDQALDWELLKDTDKKMKKKSQASDLIGEDGRSKGKTSAYDYSMNFGAINHLSSSFTTDEVSVDATSEKELGNEYFKQKKFNEAIECYSRSIALSPTAVTHANRAMAYLKIKSQVFPVRATARKELGKLKESIEDSGFALKLEPNNQEIKKQHAEVKSLYEKARDSPKASGTLRSSLQGAQKGGRSEASVNGHAVHQVSNATQRTGVSASKKDNTKENDGNYLVKKSVYVKELRDKGTSAGSKSDGQVGNDSPANATPSSNLESVQKNNRTRRQELKTSVIELASQAASRAMAEAAKNITYQFEVSWLGFSGDRALQTHLLKVTSPSALPQIFKNVLSVPILIDITKCVASLFIDDMDLSVKYLENLTKVPRFGVLIMRLSSTDMCGII